MPALRLTLALLPVATTVLLVYGLRPRRGHEAPVRLAIIRAAVAVGAVAIVAVETLSAVHSIDAPSFLILWIAVTLGAAVLAGARWRRDGYPQVIPRPVDNGWKVFTRPERLLAAALVLLFVAELVLALAAAPNNYDSNYYHLPKVENWASRHSVEAYPTYLLPQVILAPGAEYLLLHLRLLTGGDTLYNLVQWGAAVGGALAVSRIAAQLGAGRLGQLLAAAVFATAPIVVLESTSTQTDLVVTAWLACTASLVLDGARRTAGTPEVLTLGAAAGLTAETKSTGLMGLAPVLVFWACAQVRLARWRAVPAGAALVVLALLVVGPFLLRMDRVFGGPLGSAEHSAGLSMQRHDPAAVAVNGMRIGSSTLVVPIASVNSAVAAGVERVARALGVDPQDPAITLTSGSYPDQRWWPDEDHSPFPIQSAVVLAAVAAALAGRRAPGVIRGYALVVVVAMLLTAAVLKWQLWGNRLIVPMLALGAPLAGWWLARFAARRALAAVLAVVLAVSFVWGYGSVLLGWPRRLVGHDSVFVLDRWHERFLRQPQLADDYTAAADLVRASGAHRVGLVTRGDQWEYPWWVLLPGRQFVALESLVPGRPAADPHSVDAMLCLEGFGLCEQLAPVGWRVRRFGPNVAAAVPPA